MTKRASCPHCKRPVRVCYCHTIQQVDNQWPVHILQHPREAKHAIGTAGIAALSLNNCQLQQGENFTLNSMGLETRQAVLIYPGEDAESLELLRNDLPKTLVFLDASWRKSHRMLMESPELQGLVKIGLQSELASRYRIRKSKYAESLSTLEAIAHVLACLESDEAKYMPLLNSMDWMIEKQISLMGEDVYRRNYCSEI
ncbi:MAG: DTW domain-containing protein [Gammaproteobacteria bacterium]|nr:DTW domain-containing protein [Gammaproteobacteria bacterium]